MTEAHPARGTQPILVRQTNEALEWAAPSYPKPFIWDLAKLQGKREMLALSLSHSSSLSLILKHRCTHTHTNSNKPTKGTLTHTHTAIRQYCLFTVWRAAVSTHACTRRHTNTEAESRVCLHSLSWQSQRMWLCVCVCLHVCLYTH